MKDKPRKPVANIAPFGLRMQPPLKAKVEEAARENARSLNAEIVARLEESFEYKLSHSDFAASMLLLFNHMKKEGQDVDDIIDTLKGMAGPKN